MKQYGGMNKSKPKDDTPNPLEGEPQFNLWKVELNKELLAFWKSMSE